MFGKKIQVDVKKSTQKIQDPKKDSPTRFKHLRIVLEHVDVEEGKQLFETNYSHIYYIFYDNFISAETNLKQKELPFHLAHKAHREELEGVLYVLDRILTFCPELLAKRWQCHSLTRLITKLLHPGNSWKLRREAIKYLLLWYQALGENAPESIHALFASLVPGFPSPFPHLPGLTALNNPPSATIFHDGSQGPVAPVELQAIFPPQSGEKQPEDPMKYFLEALLEFMVTQVSRVEWRDKFFRQQRCFKFLFDRFKEYYLPHIFPSFSTITSLYKPVLDLPNLRSQPPSEDKKRFTLDPFMNCRVAVIKWVANFTHITKTNNKELFPLFGRSASVTPSESEGERSPLSDLRRVSVGQAPSALLTGSSVSADDNRDNVSPFSSHEPSQSEDPSLTAFNIVREVLYGSQENVNFVHEIYRQAFLLNFAYSPAIRRAITVYKDWIHMNVVEVPPFMLEPLDGHRSGPSSSEYNSMESSSQSTNMSDEGRVLRLRNDSYIGAIQKENLSVRAGMQNVLQVFITHAANVFLLEVSAEYPVLLDEQVDICKRVLNIYRYMVMHTHMEARTWEQLLLVLLRITSLILTKTPPRRKEETLGGRLAPAIFQTLIVTWIKANLNVVISSDLWERFLDVLSSLTQWEELIREWAKTLETLTRVLARHVYNLELTDLPLDRLSEQKSKKQKRIGSVMRGSQGSQARRESESPQQTKIQTDVSVDVSDPVASRDCERCLPLRRSLSENNLNLGHRRHQHKHHHQHHHHHQHSNHHQNHHTNHPRASHHQHHHSNHHHTHHSNQNIPEIEQEVARILAEPSRIRHPRKSRSMDSLSDRKAHCSTVYCDSERPSRSPSPAPSSGVESNSFKESPMQIDVLSTEGTSLEVGEGGGGGWGGAVAGGGGQRSVMSGGGVKGWLPDVAVVLWRRMLGSLGDINQLQDPALHTQVFHYLVELFDTLHKIRLNQGVSHDGQGTPPLPELVPPLTIIAPWCFQALTLPDNFHRGKLCAYRLLCQMTLMNHDVALPAGHLTQFYKVLHYGLISGEQSVVNTLVRFCGPRFLSLQLPGFSLLLLDFIHAANSVVSSSDLRATPRTEAMSILGSMLCFPQSLCQMPMLQPNHRELIVHTCLDIKDHVVNILLRCGKTETAGVARCVALSSLGIFLYQEFCTGSTHPKIKEAINTLLLALRFNHKVVAQVASDILLLLCDHSNFLLRNYPEIPPRIVEVVAGTLSHLMPIGEADKRLLTSLVFCLSEWTMRLPPKALFTSTHTNSCLLHSVFKVLTDLSEENRGKRGGSGHRGVGGSFHPDLVQEFNPNLELDNLKQEDPSPSVARRFQGMSPHLNSTGHSIQLASKMVLFVTRTGLLMSMVELPTLEVPGGGVTAGLVTAPSQVRVLLRDLAGKSCWDASILYCTPEQQKQSEENSIVNKVNHQRFEESMLNSCIVTNLPQHTLRHRPPHVLPTCENSAEDLDNLDDLLQYIGETSPECLENLDTPRNMPAAALNPVLEEEAMRALLSQRFVEADHVTRAAYAGGEAVRATCAPRATYAPPQAPFHHCRLLFSQLGLAGWERRNHLYLLDKSDKLLRELKHLDKLECRETHKVAVIYVAEGQEDRNSILSNAGGSQAYEEFVSGLGWEVELEAHTGFMGGLQANKSTGVTAPYHATSLTETIFHVATRMPSASQEALLLKTKHLGNDEVHIVWSEHTRDYRRGILPTEFCDVLIVIYPLPHSNRLYRVQVSRKPEVPYFGPLFNEAIVGHQVLPGLIRATAISASRAKRSIMAFHQQYYEERSRTLETIVRNHKNATTFEEFAAQVYSPVQTPSPFGISTTRASGVSMRSVETGSGACAVNTSSSTLAAALIDSHTHTHHNLRNRLASDISRLKGQEGGGNRVWFAAGEAGDAGISPRPLKKLALKAGSRRAPQPQQVPPSTPPDSPTSRRSK
ncbi:ral GTPase-activating protein subunit alpha-1 [Nilaparvata lugens]|uniref:ral GTPase-activating protein subunit alpha-1 n=1 Tax=Nilaparvata lugens TaxID=108931 RepID=UPI00193CFFC9|nr:ral GTPase-activating protein subunit alpha-1 [Nilaparvata lugens]